MWIALIGVGVGVLALLEAIRWSSSPSGPLASLPGPRWSIPFVGEMLEFAQDPMTWAWRRYKRYGPVFRAHLFGRQCVVVGDEKLTRSAMVSRSDVAITIPVETLTKLVDLYNVTDPVRQKLFRSHMSLALSPANLKARMHMFASVVNEHVQSWLAAGTFDLDHRLRRMVMALAFGPVAGFDLEADLLDEILDAALVVQGGIFSAPIYFPGTAWYKAINAHPGYLKLLQRAMRTKFEVDEATGEVVYTPPANPATQDPTQQLVQEFRALNEAPTIEKLAPRMVQNILGASETTFGLMLAIMAVVLMLPEDDMQARLRAEQQRVIDAYGEELSYEVVMEHMPLLDAVVRETTRLAPPAHGTFRRALVDLKLGEHTVPKGTLIMVSVDMQACLDAKVAGKVLDDDGSVPPVHCDVRRLQSSFKPERWMVGSSEMPGLFVFGFGGHACLGQQVALLESRLFLATMVRAGKWELLNKNPRIVSFPWTHLAGGPMRVRFTPAPLTRSST